MPETLARTPEPPYYAVIFSSSRTEGDEGYAAMSERMMDLAARQPGFLGVESAREGQGFGLTVSYWHDLASISNWQQNAEHHHAQREGHARWYRGFTVRVARVERQYGK